MTAQDLCNTNCACHTTDDPCHQCCTDPDAFDSILLYARNRAIEEISRMIVILERPAEFFVGTDDEIWNKAASSGVTQYRKHIAALRE